MKRFVFLSILMASSIAHADDKTDARAAYERGTAAYNKKDYATAAAEYAQADTLAPNAVALQAALDSAVKADDPVIGSELLERALARRAEGPLAKSIEAARAKFSGRAGRITVTCMDCSATLDGMAITTGAVHWAKAGPHAVVIARGASAETKTVQLEGGASVEVTPSPPPKTDPVPEPKPKPDPVPQTNPVPPPVVVVDKPVEQKSSGGISPVWFFVGAGATAAFGITAIAVGADVDAKHQQFVKAGCDRVDVGDCQSRASAGKAEQIVASVAIGGTIAFGVATILSIFFVQWKTKAKPVAAVGPNSAWVGVSTTF